MYRKKKDKARQHQVPAWPKRFFLNIGRRPHPRKINAWNWKIRRILGWYLREKRKKTKYVLDEEGKEMLGEKVTVINELEIDIEKLKKEINKRKSRTTPGIELMEYKTLGGKS